MTRPSETDDAGALVEIEASARAEVVLVQPRWAMSYVRGP
jgi:hypothetical protein